MPCVDDSFTDIKSLLSTLPEVNSHMTKNSTKDSGHGESQEGHDFTSKFLPSRVSDSSKKEKVNPGGTFYGQHRSSMHDVYGLDDQGSNPLVIVQSLETHGMQRVPSQPHRQLSKEMTVWERLAETRGKPRSELEIADDMGYNFTRKTFHNGFYPAKQRSQTIRGAGGGGGGFAVYGGKAAQNNYMKESEVLVNNRRGFT
jgi:hypothetical protein